MDRLGLVGVSVLACALVVGVAPAAGAPRGLQLASRTAPSIDEERSSGGGDYIGLDSFGDRGVEFAQASIPDYDQLAAPTMIAAPGESPKGAPRKKLKHKACIHGGWTSTQEYNPFTLACSSVGF